MTAIDPLLWHVSGTARRDRPPPCKRFGLSRGRALGGVPSTLSEPLLTRAGGSALYQQAHDGPAFAAQLAGYLTGAGPAGQYRAR